MTTPSHDVVDVSRRTFLGGTSAGLGALTLASLLDPKLLRAAGDDADDSRGVKVDRWPGLLAAPHVRSRVKRVIHLYMAGGPSHLETFDYKPKLAEMHGQPMPESFTKGQPIAQLQGAKLNCFGPQHGFKRCGQSEQEISEIFPHLATVADEIAIVRSMHTEAINHDPAHTFMNTGTTISGRPSMGSWVLYGLGAETENLPGFVVLNSLGKYGQAQPIAQRQWHSGFLPSRFQGVEFRSKGDPVLYVSRPKGVDAAKQRDVVTAVEALNQQQDSIVDDPEIATRIAQYEMAFRMQMSVPDLIDTSDETPETLELYGLSGAESGAPSFARNCLLARRLAERGVRFMQLYHRDWDHHGSLKDHIAHTAKEVDQGATALILDLKRRGLLDDTLILYGGEFGRTPMAQGNGRDHHMKGYSMWLAGGGIKPGITVGATDELGYNAVEDVVAVHDLHATILHLLGIEHRKLTYRFQGRDFRLTDVAGNVVTRLLA